jgi:hypothetical protein
MLRSQNSPVVEVRVPRGPGAVEGKGQLLVLLLDTTMHALEWVLKISIRASSKHAKQDATE